MLSQGWRKIMPAKVWKPEFAVLIYKLVRAGYTQYRIAKHLNISSSTLEFWIKKKKSVRYAMEQGKKDAERVSVKTYIKFVFDRLPPKLQKIWEKMERYEKSKNGLMRIEALLEKRGQRARQHLFLYAFCAYNFNISRACRAVNIDYKRFEAWKRDPDFHALLDEMEIHKKDFLEGALWDLIADRDSKAVIFASKTYNADRGYGQKLQVYHQGQINHTHNIVTMEELEPHLTTELKKALLVALRERNHHVNNEISDDTTKRIPA
jgi:hypothetical protein